MYTIEYNNNMYSAIADYISNVCHPDQYTLMKMFGITMGDA